MTINNTLRGVVEAKLANEIGGELASSVAITVNQEAVRKKSSRVAANDQMKRLETINLYLATKGYRLFKLACGPHAIARCDRTVHDEAWDGSTA